MVVEAGATGAVSAAPVNVELFTSVADDELLSSPLSSIDFDFDLFTNDAGCTPGCGGICFRFVLVAGELSLDVAIGSAAAAAVVLVVACDEDNVPAGAAVEVVAVVVAVTFVPVCCLNARHRNLVSSSETSLLKFGDSFSLSSQPELNESIAADAAAAAFFVANRLVDEAVVVLAAAAVVVVVLVAS